MSDLKKDAIPFSVNLKKFTIVYTMAKRIDPNVKIGDILSLRNIIEPETGNILDFKVLVIHDEGISN